MTRHFTIHLPALALCLLLASHASSGMAQERTTSLHEYVASGLNDHQSEKVFREEMEAYAPNVLLSIDRSISEVHIIATHPFDEAQFLEYALFLGVTLTERPEDE
jgi:hypothetical protein